MLLLAASAFRERTGTLAFAPHPRQVGLVKYAVWSRDLATQQGRKAMRQVPLAKNNPAGDGTPGLTSTAMMSGTDGGQRCSSHADI
jgi:hypothetical protein